MSKFKASSSVWLLAVVAMGCDVDINAVTGGPEQGGTPEYEQAETAITVAHSEPMVDIITITFNDRTQDPSDPTLGFELVEPQVPCNAQDLNNPDDTGYWGDYDALTHLIAPLDFNTDSPRFVTAFTDNRSGCDFRTKWTADMHVGAAVIQ
jgi:hypothetical protein